MEIYAGNLPWATTSEELADLFRPYGDVADAHVNVDRDTGRSKGFGFVVIEDDEAARTAISDLDGSTVGTRTIRVSPAAGRRRSGPRRR